MSPVANRIVKALFARGWAEASELVIAIDKRNPEGLAKWEKEGRTVYLRDELALPHKGSSIYNHRGRVKGEDPMPWDNDWTAIDTVWFDLKKEAG